MAISYSLEVATPASAVRVAQAVRDIASDLGLFDSTVAAEQVLNEGASTVTGTWIRVVETKPQSWNPVVSDLGFTPSVSVAFRLDKETEISAQQDDMVRITSRLLDRVFGDAVLHSVYETIWLLRRSGDVTLSERADLWPDNRLATVAQTYRRATHRFADE